MEQKRSKLAHLLIHEINTAEGRTEIMDVVEQNKKRRKTNMD